MRRRSFLAILSAAAVGRSQTKEAALNRPKTPGTLNLRTRRRSNNVSEGTARWEVAQTAIIICDMWDAHTCSLSAQRVAVMAPRMNQVVSNARSLGVMIVHAPSDTMKFYEGTPWRERMQRAPIAASPTPILTRCAREPIEERNFPIDDSARVVAMTRSRRRRQAYRIPGQANTRRSMSSVLTASATTGRRSTTSSNRKTSSTWP